MATLTPFARGRLLAIDGLRGFVEREEKRYVKVLKDWKKVIPPKHPLADPEVLAGSLMAYLKFADSKLQSIMWALWKNDLDKLNEYYDLVARYFVDAEAAT